MSREAGMEKKILIADDQKGVRNLLEEYFKQQGHWVIAVSNGLEAIEAVQKEKIDLIILDMKMPAMNGLEAARRILQNYNLPIILMTAYAESEIEKNAMAAGIKRCITKPFEILELKDIVADCLKV
jgi:two-component system response regulator (stage 0 sporulation protein F)